MVAILMATILGNLDASIANVALPTIHPASRQPAGRRGLGSQRRQTGVRRRGAAARDSFDLASALLNAALLACHQCARTAPLVPIDLLRIPLLRLSVGTSICSYTRRRWRCWPYPSS